MNEKIIIMSIKYKYEDEKQHLFWRQMNIYFNLKIIKCLPVPPNHHLQLIKSCYLMKTQQV